MRLTNCRLSIGPGNASGRPVSLVRRARVAAFTLIEAVVTVAVIAILAAIAYPAYVDAVTRARITQAMAALSDFRVKMEQFFQDNRRYDDGAGNCGVVDPPANATDHFRIACTGASANGFTATANGLGALAPAQYGIVVDNGSGVRRSTVVPIPGWNLPSPNNCWAIRRNGTCS